MSTRLGSLQQDWKGRGAPDSGWGFSVRLIAAFLVVFAVMTVLSAPVYAQCALCVTALENSPEGRGMAGSFNRGILFLLAAPYAIFGTVGIVVFRAYRKKKLAAQRENPYIPKD